MQTENEGLKFLSADIENFKNISKKVVDIGGRSLIVMGENGAGKSSFLQALMSPLNAKVIPSKPVKEGEDRSTVQVVIGGKLNGEEKLYTLDLYFTPKNGKGRLVVTNEKGETVKSPATLMKSILGNISFDIFEFLNDTKANKIKTLKQLTGKGKEIDIANNEIALKKEERKKTKQRVEDSEASLKNHGLSDEDIEKYSEPIDMSSIQEELANISKSIDTYSSVEAKVAQFKKDIESEHKVITICQNDIIDLKNKIMALEDKVTLSKQAIKSHEANVEKGELWLKDKTKPSAEAISAKITEASLHNDKHAKVNEFATKQREMIHFKQTLQKMGIEIESLENKRDKIISSSQLPVKGLTFTDEDIFIDGLPLEEGQVNTARMIDIGSDLSIALNPNLKVIFIHEGSLMDKKTLKALVVKAEKKGYQCIIETVKDDAELEVAFTENEL